MHVMRGSQVAAQAMGVNILKYRLIAFALSTGYASLAGALYVHFIKFVYPSTWTLMISLTILAIIVIGGLRSIYGTFLGALVVYAMAELAKMGIITNKRKNINKGQMVATMVLGNEELYRFVDHNAGVALYDGAWVNDPYVIAQNDNQISINTSLEVDLTGQCASESIGSRQFSGTGGQADTAIGAQMSKGGRSIIALYSTAMGCDEAYLLSDRAFGGADTLATSYTLAKAAEKIGEYDLLLFGRHAIDGDTAQTGPAVAAQLGIPQITLAGSISVEDGWVCCDRMGSLNGKSYDTLAIGAPLILVGVIILYLLRWRLNILPLSDDEARASGTNVKALRIVTVLCATAITASCVSMAGSFLNVTTYPSARAGGETLSERLGQKHLYLPNAYDFDEIEQGLRTLAGELGAVYPGSGSRRSAADEALKRARSAVGGREVAIDYTAVSRPLQLAKLLTEYGFSVTDLFVDAIPAEDKPSLEWLKENLPELRLHPTVHPAMVVTDSQAFGRVSADTPSEIPLTSFSILMARYKGVLRPSIEGVAALENLRDGDTVLISEGCTHHRQCDDIGTRKIPRWLKEHTGRDLAVATTSGTEFPDDLSPYAAVIHCGGCMLNEREMLYRMSMKSCSAGSLMGTFSQRSMK